MDKFRKELLLGALLVTVLGLAQLSWAQQHDHDAHGGHTDNTSDSAAADTGQIFDSSQLTQQNENTMQQRQGGMMQRRQGQDGGQGNMMQHQENGDMMQRMQQMRRRMGGGQNANAGDQDAFSAIRAVVKQLEADPDTDWSKVNIDALRNHLVDMHELTVNAAVESSEVPEGASYRVTGTGRTLEAIRNMVAMHASQMTVETEWTAVAEEIRNGMEVTVTADSDNEVAKIRALGFMGFMVSGDHHEMHHMAIVGADMESMSATDGGHDH